MKLPLTGGCQCGAVRYEIDAEPLIVIACHCTQCQRQSASAFGMTVPVPHDALRIVKGTPQHWSRIAESGNMLGAMFCPTCGVRLYHEPAYGKFLNVKAGTFDDTSWAEPVGHIWTEMAQPWVRERLTGVIYPRQQPNMDAFIAAWRDRNGG
jgi:hypothetical protein